MSAPSEDNKMLSTTPITRSATASHEQGDQRPHPIAAECERAPQATRDELHTTIDVGSVVGHARNRILTMELGQLAAAGLSIEHATLESAPTVHVRAIKRHCDAFVPVGTESVLVSLERRGLHERPFNLLKFRTMYPYAAFLQEFLMYRNGLLRGDKIKDDFRVTPVGALLRRFWLDELPSLWNLFRGDCKLVGVRPLSEAKLGVYDEELRTRRALVRPGLIPPSYADLPQSLTEFMASEERYLQSYQKAPMSTDLKYLCKAVLNVVLFRVRSA